VALEESLGDDRSHEARWIVERVSGFSSGELIAAADEPVSGRSVAFFDAIVGRRCAGEPLQYALGVWPFRSLELVLDARVLIPRPETEQVAGYGIDHLRTYGPDRDVYVADLGTGSGAIGLSIASEVPRAHVVLGDVSADALAVARANLVGLGRAATRVRIIESDWFTAMPDDLRHRLDLVIANPPYIALSDEVEPVVVEWEPSVALWGGERGLDHIETIITDVSDWLAPGGLLVMEHGADQGEATRALAEQAGLTDVRTLRDFTGRDRALLAAAPPIRA
jgi:release factor glutamine methyltransferase